jgi:hypothetical protein
MQPPPPHPLYTSLTAPGGTIGEEETRHQIHKIIRTPTRRTRKHIVTVNLINSVSDPDPGF